MGTHDLHVEVRGSCIAVTLPGFAYSVTYYTAAGNRRLISEPGWSRSIAGAPMTLSEFYTRAWTAANDKARELGWIA